MRIHLINLDRSADRLAEFSAQNVHLTGVSRFAAVDGTKIDASEFVGAGILTQEILDWYTPGALGCALSHISLWDRAIAACEAVTVCEDDAIFNRHFEREAQRVLEALPPDWDIVFWGHNCGAHLLLELAGELSIIVSDRAEMQRALAAFQNRSFTTQPLKLVQMFGLVCYSISPKGAAELRKRCLPLRPAQVHSQVLGRALSNYGLDCAAVQHYADLQAFVTFPPLVLAPNNPSRSQTQL
jgi:glycosyl transferase, family 25